MRLLTSDEQNTLRHRYKHNDLFRQWSPILGILQRNFGEADAQTLWHLAEQKIVLLRGELSYREQEISPIYQELISESMMFNKDIRTQEQARHTASTVMCIMLTMLMNAVEKGHENEGFDNEPMCMAIMDILSGDLFSQKLMNLFFNRGIGYDGQKVVIAACDPMLEGTIFESMDEVAKNEFEQMIRNVINRTQGLNTLFGKYWAAWETLWRDICTDTQMLLMLKKTEPSRNDWNMNQKMVCNVVGMVKDKVINTLSIKSINDVLCSKNVRSYISNHSAYGSDSVFNREQHDKVIQMINKCFLSI